MKRGDKRRHNPGRPSKGVSEGRLEVRAPHEWIQLVRERAEMEGLTASEWLRVIALHAIAQPVVRLPPEAE